MGNKEGKIFNSKQPVNDSAEEMSYVNAYGIAHISKILFCDR